MKGLLGLFAKKKDPVCGAKVSVKNALVLEYGGKKYYFDSMACMNSFLKDTDKYTGKGKKKFLEKLAESNKDVPKSCHECH